MHRDGGVRLTGQSSVTRSGRPSHSRLIVMTRFPQPGRVKTRLVPALGEAGAAELHAELARRCVRRMHAGALSTGLRLEVHATGAPAHRVRKWLGRNVHVRGQGEGDLGERLAAAARGAFAAGAPSALIVGSDAPGLSGTHVREALRALEHSDVVLGPATDGGYYLVAIAADSAVRALPPLFGPHVPWGSHEVLEVTSAAAHAAGLSVHLLEPLSDIDRPDDLVIWEHLSTEEERIRLQPRLTIVIPALNEEADIAKAVESAWGGGAHEVIVADGASDDRTAQIAASAGARVIDSGRGRARQLNAGAAAANGDILLFLHADTVLPPDTLQQVCHVMARPEVVLGSFSFAAGDPRRRLDLLISTIGAWRHRVFRLPYGDQAPFVRTSDFEDLGGFSEQPAMEDYEFAVRCSRLGRLETSPAIARTSARAWHESGLLRTTFTNAAVIAGYRMGVSAERLASWRARIAVRDSTSTDRPRANGRDRNGRSARR